MSLSVIAVAFLVTVLLAVWNRLVASDVFEWSTDPKNTYLFITKRLNPAALKRDFPFGDERIFRFYQPIYMGVAVRLAKMLGGIIPATRALHFVFTFAYMLGWLMLARECGAQPAAAALFVLALVPYVPVTGADGISVGAPGTWWSRSMANAFVPWFGLLSVWHFESGTTLLAAFAIVGTVLYLHPVVAVGLLPALACIPIVDFVTSNRIPIAQIIVGIIGLGACGVIFARGYLKSSSSSTEPKRAPDWDRVNALAFSRFRLWPYELFPGDSWPVLARANRYVHVVAGAAYLFAAVAAVVAPVPLGTKYYLIGLMNFGALVFLHIPPGEGSGVRLAVISGLGVAGVLTFTGWGSIAAVLLLLVLSRIRFRRVFLGTAVVATATITMSGLLQPAVRAVLDRRVVTPFDWWLALTVPAVFAWYLAGSWVTMDLLPLKLHKPLKVIDWGRTAKIAQLPMYIYVLYFLRDIFRSGVPSIGMLIVVGLVLGTLMLNPLTAYRRHLHPSDKALFDWSRQTNQDSLFHVVSGDIWFGFDFRANTVRAITGTWKDGGICHYSDVDRFFEWDARMQMVRESIQRGTLSKAVDDGRSLGADFVIVDTRLALSGDADATPQFSNERWTVLTTAARSAEGQVA